MLLSHAIKLGSMMHKQGFGAMININLEGNIKTCALGAAEKGGYKADYCKALNSPPKVCPECHLPWSGSIYDVVVHLNDFHRWTRPAIAEWLVSSGNDIDDGVEAPCQLTNPMPITSQVQKVMSKLQDSEKLTQP